jgi:regulatory protein
MRAKPRIQRRPRESGSSQAYLDALKMLARRELSEAQVRQRLARKPYDPDTIDEVMIRLRAERAVDDARAAETIARQQASVKLRGSRRVRRHLEAAGIGEPAARRAVDDVFGSIDTDALLEAALNRRLRGRDRITDQTEFRRLHRYLIEQGFDPERVTAALIRRKVLDS